MTRAYFIYFICNTIITIYRGQFVLKCVYYCLFLNALCVQALFMLGALLIAMSVQLDRKGLWNMLGPILCAILFMVISWVRYTPSYYRKYLKHYLMGICCCSMHISFVYRCTEGCGDDTVTRRLGNDGSST